MAQTLPVRYPFGVSTSNPKSIFRDYPAVQTGAQFKFWAPDFAPYQSGQWTVTQTNGTVAAYAWLGGVVKMSTTGGSASDTVNLAGAQVNRIQGGTRSWFRTRVAIPSASATDIAFYAGLSDNVNPASATNGILFKKASGGTALSLLIIKGGTTTTFNNIGDVSKPSGVYGDTSSTVGTLTPNATGTTLTALTIATAGSGYAEDPLVVMSGTAGSGADARVEIGSGSLYNAVITAAGSGYTAGTFSAEIDHWVSMAFCTDSRGSLLVQINGVQVLAIGPYNNNQNTFAAGDTKTVSGTANSWTTTTALAAGVMTNLPPAGDFMNVAPLVEMYPAVGYTGTTANARNFYCHEVIYAGDL